MHRGIAILAALLLGGCMHVFQDGRAEGVPVVVEVPPPEETQQLAELVLSAQRFSRASAEQQKRELAAANKAFAADKRNVLARLRLGMLLQTDPSVIYGIGERFDGNLRKQDLRTDTPYNTYTRPGLPPTPIALPGMAAIEAVMHPADTDALYFVARGDGTSHFSRTLDEHNRAVNRYQRNGRQ